MIKPKWPFVRRCLLRNQQTNAAPRSSALSRAESLGPELAPPRGLPIFLAIGNRLNFSTGRPCLVEERKYTKRHEWISATSGGRDERVGLTQYCQDALGDIVFAQLPEVGLRVKKFDECGTLESVKAASEVYAPLDGGIA